MLISQAGNRSMHFATTFNKEIVQFHISSRRVEKSDKLKKGVGENVAQVKTAKSNQFFRQNAHASWNAACCSLVSSNKLYNTISSDRNLLLGVIWRKKQGRKISWSVGLVKSLTIRYYWSSSRRKRRSTLPLWSIICGKECQIPLRIKVLSYQEKIFGILYRFSMFVPLPNCNFQSIASNTYFIL